jgi:hypothetical protein
LAAEELKPQKKTSEGRWIEEKRADVAWQKEET